MKNFQRMRAALCAMAMMATAAQAEEALTVLTYNVCWQCMSSDKYGLQGQCKPETITAEGRTHRVSSCAVAMGKAIDGYAAGYDLVGLQEASHWEDLRFLAPNTLGQMTAADMKSGHEYMVSFYNPRRFTLAFAPVQADMGAGRPILVLPLRDSDGSGVIFVNLHNCHGACGFAEIDQAIAQGLREAAEGGTIDYANAAEFIAASRVIVVGDFNEVGSVYTRARTQEVDWAPFAEITPNKQVKQSQAPTSCCSTELPWDCKEPATDPRPWCRPGDYIFDSKAPAVPMIAPGYDDTVAQSDHKPVIAVLD